MKKSLIIIIVLFFFANMWVVLNTPLVSWDESVYIGIGKFIFSNGESGLYEPFRPMLLPLILGALWKISLPVVISSRILVLFFSVSSLIVFYKIGKMYFNTKTALLLTVILASVPVYFIYSTKVFTGIVSMFFVLVAFYSYLKQRYYLTSLFCGLATLTRFPAGMFFIIFFILIFMDKRKLKVNFNMGLIFLLSLSPLFILNLYFGYDILKPILHALTHQENYVFQKSLFFYFKKLFFDSVFLIFSIPGLYYGIRKRKYTIIFLSLVPLIYFTNIINKQERFLNLFIPFIVLLAGVGFYYLLKEGKNSRVITYTVLFILVLSIPLSIGNIVREDLSNETDIPYIEEDNLTIITSHPVFSAYTDNRFIPAYFSAKDANKKFSEYEDEADLFIYRDVYPCNKLKSQPDCHKEKVKLISRFLRRDLKYKYDQYYIFE